MSDAKAKAEARRAKILAREKSKTVSAVTTEEDEGLLIALGESKARERPIAARRSLIESVTKVDEETSSEVKTEGDSATTEGNDNSSSTTAPNSAESAATDKGEITPKKDSTEKRADTPSLSEKKSIKLPPKKTLEEIEREIAENTRKFDERTLGKKLEPEEKESTSEKKKDKKTEKKGDDKDEKSDDKKDKETEAEKDSTSEKVKKAIKAKSVSKYSIEPSTAMRILRLILIVLCAAWTGYRVVLRNKAALNAFSQPDQDEFDLSNSAFQQATASTADRTWIQYFQYRLNGQLEAPVSAILFIYWVSKMFTPVVNGLFKVPKPKQTNFVQMAFEFLQTGLATWLEGVYTVLGEMSLHFVILVVSVIMWTIYLADAVNQLDQTSPAPLSNNNEL